MTRLSRALARPRPRGLAQVVSEPLSQADVEQAWPQWKTWEGTDQMCHARRAGGAALTETGEDWPDLADQIRRAEAMLEASLLAHLPGNDWRSLSPPGAHAESGRR